MTAARRRANTNDPFSRTAVRRNWYGLHDLRETAVQSIYIIVGAILIVYPYLFSNAILVFVAGAVLTVIPYAHQRGII